MSITSMEWGFRAHEKGMNLQQAIAEYNKLIVAGQATDTRDQPLDAEPLWRTFSEADQNELAIAQMEEIRDCAKDLALEALDNITDRQELLGMIADIELLNEIHQAQDTEPYELGRGEDETEEDRLNQLVRLGCAEMRDFKYYTTEIGVALLQEYGDLRP